ncbi:MAG: response regulator [Syntrophobacteraceae bacterium]|jgi:DNA-binding NarL/FixJ family response regulator|nr:response regulator [Syntrophobacteraceae bacterium]
MASRKPRIFIVEDEIVIVRGLEDALNGLGYAVCGFAFSGKEASEKIIELNPDLVLADVRLSGEMDGIELADEIIARLNIPVIYITAYSDREVLERAKVTDPCGYIVKPVRHSQLKVNIELALERFRKEREKDRMIEAYRTTIEELRTELTDSRQELRNHQERLQAATSELERKSAKIDELRHELQDVNRSLLSLTSHLTRLRGELEMEVAAALNKRVLPILRELRSDPALLGHYRIQLDMLAMQMDHLSMNIIKKNQMSEVLTMTELRIAALIKNSMSSSQIADQLCLSPDTVKTHRRNIRRKLGLQKTGARLSLHLKGQLV